MKTLLDYQIHLNSDPDNKNLYPWALYEVDESGAVQRSEYVPFKWASYFEGISVEVRDSARKNKASSDEDDTPHYPTLANSITVKLRPCCSGSRDGREITPRYSLMGTNRTLDEMTLEILPTSDSKMEGKCSVWGMVAYEDEEFGTQQDCLQFKLWVRPGDYARYEAKLTRKWADGISFSVERVPGFYAWWSPGIDASVVKILTSDQQGLQGAREPKIDVPRLADIHRYSLNVSSSIDLRS